MSGTLTQGSSNIPIMIRLISGISRMLDWKKHTDQIFETSFQCSVRVGFISIQIKLRNSAFQVPKQNRKCQILNFSIGDFYQSIQNSREYQEKMKLRRVLDDF